MPLEIPQSPKVYTTIYSDFRGVDYTNDATNVWKRRSPSGVNMLPDASGRPFKRNGWETVITSNELLELLHNDGIDIEETQIYRCFYFELGGEDNIVIFANGGVFVYTQDTLSLLDGSNDVDCFRSSDRAFFFEGGGTSAFYIFGNFKIWKYAIENGEYTFGLVEADIPTVLITASADCVGETLQSYNMLSNKANIDYQNNDLFHSTTSGDMTVSVDKNQFLLSIPHDENDVPIRAEYVFEYDLDTTSWSLNGTTVTLSTYGIDILVGTPDDEDTITVLYVWGVLLPTNIIQKQIDDVRVKATRVEQFKYEFTVLPEKTEGIPNSPSTTEVVLHTDDTSYHDLQTDLRKAWIEFLNAEPLGYGTEGFIDDGEDKIEVTFPITEVTIDTYDEQVGSGQAVIDRG